MVSKISLKEEVKSRIQQLIEVNMNPTEIIKKLQEEKLWDNSRGTLEARIADIMGMKWDKKGKEWKDIKKVSDKEGRVEKTEESPGQLPETHSQYVQMAMEGVTEEGKFQANVTVDKKEYNKSESKESPADTKDEQNTEQVKTDKTENEKTGVQEHINYQHIIDELRKTSGEIRDELYHIKKELHDNRGLISSLTDSIEWFKRENPPGKDEAQVDDLIAIYAGSKGKQSVYINKEIMDKVTELLAETMNIKGNDSLVINTALLIALYKSNMKDRKKK